MDDEFSTNIAGLAEHAEYTTVRGYQPFTKVAVGHFRNPQK